MTNNATMELTDLGLTVYDNEENIIGWIRAGSTCGNPICFEGNADRRTHHAIPSTPGTILPDYHFATIDDAVAALVRVS